MSLVRFDRASYPEELVTIERRLQQACAHLLVWDARSSLAARGKPKTIRLDNGPEFAGRLLDSRPSERCRARGINLGRGSISRRCRDHISKSSRCGHNQRGSAARLQVLRPLDHFASIAAPDRAAQFGHGRCASKKSASDISVLSMNVAA